MWRYVEIFEPCSRRLQQILSALGGLGNKLGSDEILVPIGQEELLLCRVEIWGVVLKQRLALGDFNPQIIDVELLDPPRYFHVDVANARLVVINRAHGSDGSNQGPGSHRLDPDSNVLGDDGIDRDLA